MYLTVKDLVREFPRGAPVGTRVAGGFIVVAEQVWRAGDRQEIVGLVWEAQCSVCGGGFVQLTQTHPEAFRKECFECLPSLFSNHDPARGWFRSGEYKGIRRRGIIERHVLTLLDGRSGDIPLVAFVDEAEASLPAPEDGKRDTRRQRILRALDSLSKEKDGPLQVKGGQIILYDT